MSQEEQTARIVRAVANPRTTILGHVTGRQLLRRPGYEVVMEKILQACEKHGVAVELNANPYRIASPRQERMRLLMNKAFDANGRVRHRAPAAASSQGRRAFRNSR